EQIEIADIILKRADMAALRIAEQALRASLSSPVGDGDGEAAAGQVTYGLEIFLDALVAAGQDDDGAAPGRFCVGGEPRVTYAYAVGGVNDTRRAIRRGRIAGRFKKYVHPYRELTGVTGRVRPIQQFAMTSHHRTVGRRAI